MNRSDKNLNKGIKDTQGEIRNLCNISRKCTNKQFMKACDEAYSKIVSGNDVEKAIDSSIRKLSQKGIEVIDILIIQLQWMLQLEELLRAVSIKALKI